MKRKQEATVLSNAKTDLPPCLPQSPSRKTPGCVSPVGTPSAGLKWRPRPFLRTHHLSLSPRRSAHTSTDKLSSVPPVKVSQTVASFVPWNIFNNAHRTPVPAQRGAAGNRWGPARFIRKNRSLALPTFGLINNKSESISLQISAQTLKILRQEDGEGERVTCRLVEFPPLLFSNEDSRSPPHPPNSVHEIINSDAASCWSVPPGLG